MPGLDTLEKRVKLKGYVETQTPLHIGMGKQQGATGSDMPVLLDITGTPVIPGSSFKGVLRAQIEALIRGLQQGGNSRLTVCNVVEDNYCVPKGLWQDKPAVILARACDACLLFGGPYIGAKLSICEMTAQRATWDRRLVGVRDGVGINRDSRTAEGKKKFDFEIVPPGVRFDLEMTLDNPEPYEIGLLLRVIRLFDEGFATLGGKSSRGTGRIRARIDTVTTLAPSAFFKTGALPVIELTEAEWQTYYDALLARVEGRSSSAAVSSASSVAASGTRDQTSDAGEQSSDGTANDEPTH